MKRRTIGLVVALAVLVVLPGRVLAQDDEAMSFTEEEATSPQPAAEAAAPAEEDTDSDTETAEESAGGTGDADVLGALGADGAATGESKPAGKTEDEPAKPGHEIWAVQQVYALRAGRVDVQPSFGISMNDPYVQHQAINLAGAYYITEVLAVGVSFNFYRWLDAETDLNFSVSRATHQTVPINEYFWGGQLNFTYVPMYGKFSLLNEWILHWDVWVLGGGGFIFTRPIPVIDPDYREFDFSMKFSFNVGFGARLYLSRFLAIYVEMRDYIFPEELENRTTYSDPEERADKGNWMDSDSMLTNNVMLNAGVSLFVPFTFDYELPK